MILKSSSAGRRLACAVLLLLWHELALSDKPAPPVKSVRGEAVYGQRCAVCHDHPGDRIPPRIVLSLYPADTVVLALTRGLMQPMATGLSTEDITAVATFLTGRRPGTGAHPVAKRCDQPGGAVVVAPTDWPSMERDARGSRYQPEPGLRAVDVPRLRLKWAWSYGDGALGPVTMAGGRLFVPASGGRIDSLDAGTGCTHWSFESGRLVRSVSVGELPGVGGKAVVLFGDDQGTVTALDATTGALLWKTQVENHVLARVTSPPLLHDGRVFVPMSSMEDPMTHDPSYACCTFRGSVAALDATTGKLLWKSYTIEQEPQPRAPANAAGPQHFSPAGAAVFTPLAVDAKRGLVYATTAESYTEDNPAGAYSVIAFDMATGAHRWQKQFLPAAADRARVCSEAGETDCRNLFSFSSQAMLHTLPDGRDIVIAGQKWGYMYGLDPADGREIWRNKMARGSDLGGVQYGFSADPRAVYVSISDVTSEKPGGLVALDPRNGETLWRAAPIKPSCHWGEQGCSSAQAAATTTIPGIVFSGAWDGHLRAYSVADGRVVWDVDTAIPVRTVNGVEARGGQVSGWPVVVAGGAVYVTSGASSRGRPGNALLVYTVDGR